MTDIPDDIAAQVDRFTDIMSGVNLLTRRMADCTGDEILVVAADCAAAFVTVEGVPHTPERTAYENGMLASLLKKALAALEVQRPEAGAGNATYLAHAFGMGCLDAHLRLRRMADPSTTAAGVLHMMWQEPDEYLAIVRRRVAAAGGATSPPPTTGEEG